VRLSTLWRKLLFPIAIAAPLALVAMACTNEPMPTFTEVLVAPPGVPVGHERGNTHVIVNLVATEQTSEIAPGVTYTEWTFNGTVPGPMIRARVGDVVEVHLKNPSTSTMTHNIDLHAVNGPGGGAGVTTVAPGDEKAFTFLAKTPGLFVYHCAAGIVADHITNGMYGAILIEPATGLSAVDHEYYLGQSEFYTTGDAGAKGHQDLDFTKLTNEEATYVVFNGNTTSLLGNNALQAKVGETVRLYVTNGGPNLISSFHVIGEIFDKAYEYGGLLSPPLEGIQTILVPPGGATITEFKVDVPGDYKLVDHAIIRVSKGAVGTLHVTGDQDPKIFNSLSGVTGAAATGHDMSTPVPAAATTAAAAATAGGSTTGNPKVETKDNLFATTSYTVKAGQKVTFDITNSGKVPHNMRVAQADGSFDGAGSVASDPEIVNPGKTATLSFTPTTPGTYKFRCDIHPDQMTGTITVQ
jgi:nitrite reductase (NO-forming)